MSISAVKLGILAQHGCRNFFQNMYSRLILRSVHSQDLELVPVFCMLPAECSLWDELNAEISRFYHVVLCICYKTCFFFESLLA